jgi:glyoxylase-like metal-dependent hydrolase (beta-lactamase superfamily II)
VTAAEDEMKPVSTAPGHPEILRLVADNPGPMTLTGTNTYLVGSDPCWVIDPGPEDARHVAAVAAAVGERGGAAGVLLTHSHNDHTGAVGPLGIEVVELVDGLRLRIGGSPGAPDAKGEFAGGDRGPDASWLTAVATPGHAVDHFCFFTDDGICFSGDLILGWGSTYVPPDGGSLAAYMDSLRLVASREPGLICPGHGPWVTDPSAKITEYLEHRESRERGLLELLGRGERSRMALLEGVWSDVPELLRPAAAVVMEAHLQKLGNEGRLPKDLGE